MSVWEIMDYELAIIGAGPAGYSAAIYAGRSGIKTVVFDKIGGGGLALVSPKIENYAGFESIPGSELMDKMQKHASKYADFHFTSEENIATSCNLPGVSGHHHRHQELLEEFNQHAEDLSKGSKTVDDFLGFLTDWFIGHTVYEDQKLFKAI